MVTGSTGQVGSELKELAASYPDMNFIFLDRKEASIEDPVAMEQAMQRYSPEYLINCAAYTAVDRAEQERETAFQVNGKAVGILAELCKRYQCRFIHLSTDYVFSGHNTVPWKETDVVDPVNAYGESKLLGEKLAMENNPETIIIRTAWVYSYYGNNFVKTMLRLMKEKEQIGVVHDQVGTPTYAVDLAEAILAIVRSGTWVPGIYHYSNSGCISWFEFASEIRALTQAACQVNPITTQAFPTPAKRPAYSVLDKSKITATFPVAVPDWKESLKRCLQRLKP